MRLILPITLQNFMFALVPVSDAVMLVALDQDAMSAVSLATQVMFVFNLFVFALLSGLSMFAAQYWGKGDVRSIEKLLGYTTRLMLPVLALFFSTTFFLPGSVMKIYTDDPVIIAHGIKYLRIVSISYVVDGIGQLYATVLKNTDHVKESTILSILMVFMNIGLNAVFIYGLLGMPRMGAAGAALATTIAMSFGFVAFTVAMILRCPAKIRIGDILASDISMRRRFSKYSTPFLINQLFWGFGFTMISVIMGHLGADAVAANAIVAVVKDLASCFCFALGSGGAIIVGNELGAGELRRGKEYGGKIAKLAIISGIIMGALVAASTPLLVPNLNLTSKASEYLTQMMLMCVYYILGRSINATVIAGIFAAGGDTRFGMICDTLTMWAFIVPVGALAAFYFKLPVLAVYFILNLDEMVKLPAVYIHYKKYKWVRNIVETGPAGYDEEDLSFAEEM